MQILFVGAGSRLGSCSPFWNELAMSPNLVWHPIRFTQQIERAYVEQMELRVVPLQRLACMIGIATFAGYQLWDLLLDPQAFPRTAPIRLAIIALLSELIITFVPSLRRPPYLLMQNIAVYTFVGVGFSLILAQLPNGFLAGVSGFLLGMIFIPVVVIGTVQAVATLTPLVLSPLVVMALAGATRLEIVNALSWIVGGAGFVIGFAYLLDVINRRAFQLEQLLETEKNRSERLLLNILPADIAERLKAEEEPLADRCDAVTVLFADLVGFTELSRKLRAGDVVDLLNDLFSRFDRLVEWHGAEKIQNNRRRLHGCGGVVRQWRVSRRINRRPGSRHAGSIWRVLPAPRSRTQTAHRRALGRGRRGRDRQAKICLRPMG